MVRKKRKAIQAHPSKQNKNGNIYIRTISTMELCIAR